MVAFPTPSALNPLWHVIIAIIKTKKQFYRTVKKVDLLIKSKTSDQYELEETS